MLKWHKNCWQEIFFILVSQPNIHPGSISSTGRQRGSFCQGSQAVPTMNAAGVITPAMFGPATVCIFFFSYLYISIWIRFNEEKNIKINIYIKGQWKFGFMVLQYK